MITGEKGKKDSKKRDGSETPAAKGSRTAEPVPTDPAV